ncbi:hypothetical protein [Brachyspira hyodysenteriae]|uniref:hypothetical protein n=1 Tax=Brachyspira hyodysenteriae TaxID=159 RepID=UPI0022CD301A|nr:hypothetical protein [Brachyspira hyodysenteriae]MCZ9886059.1 hypothetical protein [Brachyspira hyodysenteriae]MDA0054156.1 hypothetical protein [Brachyspira hyodysenteriae]
MMKLNAIYLKNDLEELDNNFDINSISKDISPVIDELSYIIEKINSIVCYCYCNEKDLIFSIENNYHIEDFFIGVLEKNYYDNSYNKRYGDDYIPNDDMDPIDIIFDRDFQ